MYRTSWPDHYGPLITLFNKTDHWRLCKFKNLQNPNSRFCLSEGSSRNNGLCELHMWNSRWLVVAKDQQQLGAPSYVEIRPRNPNLVVVYPSVGQLCPALLGTQPLSQKARTRSMASYSRASPKNWGTKTWWTYGLKLCYRLQMIYRCLWHCFWGIPVYLWEAVDLTNSHGDICLIANADVDSKPCIKLGVLTGHDRGWLEDIVPMMGLQLVTSKSKYSTNSANRTWAVGSKIIWDRA